MKLKPTDKVRIKSKLEISKAYGSVYGMPGGWVSDMDGYCGTEGVIIGRTLDGFLVRFDNGEEWGYGEEALTLSKCTVTITFDGNTTFATDGEHVEAVTLCHGKEYSQETGAIEAIKKLYHRFPQKGDEVFFVGIGHGKAYVGNCIFDDTHEIDRLHRKSGDIYETKAAAQKVANRVNAIFKEGC